MRFDDQAFLAYCAREGIPAVHSREDVSLTLTEDEASLVREYWNDRADTAIDWNISDEDDPEVERRKRAADLVAVERSHLSWLDNPATVGFQKSVEALLVDVEGRLLRGEGDAMLLTQRSIAYKQVLNLFDHAQEGLPSG